MGSMKDHFKVILGHFWEFEVFGVILGHIRFNMIVFLRFLKKLFFHVINPR